MVFTDKRLQYIVGHYFLLILQHTRINSSQIPNMLHDICRAVPWNIYLKYIFHKNVEAIPNKQKLSMLALTLMEIRRLKIVHVVQRRHKYSGHVTQSQETTKHKVFSKIYDVQDIVHTINTSIQQKDLWEISTTMVWDTSVVVLE